MTGEKMRKAGTPSRDYLTDPFIRRDGSLVNKYMDYRKASSERGAANAAVSLSKNISDNKYAHSFVRLTGADYKNETASDYKARANELILGAYAGSVGKKVANTQSYNNSAAVGQCVWYARGRAKEKLGVETGSLGNANEMWYNAKSTARKSADAANIKPDMIASYKTGTSSGGQKYGHVIYIEDVVGDIVYYTEGGSGYHKNGTDGVVKTATKEGIMQGVNASGTRFGSGLIGFIDMTQY